MNNEASKQWGGIFKILDGKPWDKLRNFQIVL